MHENTWFRAQTPERLEVTPAESAPPSFVKAPVLEAPLDSVEDVQLANEAPAPVVECAAPKTLVSYAEPVATTAAACGVVRKDVSGANGWCRKGG